ncbi:MAG: hypothetical protein Q4C85_08670 [Actinomyces sp.]|uniref:hypothetical protein n=1 Tax=Actinomyces sp. TaxID=29317 RepID=UPI0026DD64AA|nr:hypothetical protein [Actinomyces sp.]MDO4243811.1 hypothetical protein [Actinomyces sp.]
MSAGGWSVCPICGSVIADIWLHTTWHESTLAELIADMTTTITDDEPADVPAETGDTA